VQRSSLKRIDQKRPFNLRCLMAGIVFGLGCMSPSMNCQAQENRNQFNQLLLPTSRKAQSALQQSCQLWSVQQLRPSIVELESHFPISIWLDRRIDSGQEVALSRTENSSTLGDELERMAISCGAAGGLVENIYLIAPASRLARIQRAAVVLHGQLASSQKNIADDSRMISWPDITSSQELLELIQQTWGVELVDARLPHDLLHQGKLPRCSLATQLALLLGGFDQQASYDPELNRSPSGSTASPIKLKIQPLGTTAVWQDNYSRVLTQTQVSDLKEKFPQSDIEPLQKNATKLKGETNAHIAMLTSGLGSTRPKQRRPDKAAENRLSLEIATPIPVEAVLKNLAEKLKFQLEWSEECTSMHRNRVIKLTISKATRQELLDAIGQVADLRVIDRQTKVLVSPK
jgi:hypothetical protein